MLAVATGTTTISFYLGRQYGTMLSLSFIDVMGSTWHVFAREY
jgi:hypothetical protein